MITRIVKIGNSQGIRIPKALLEESGLTGEVDLQVKKGTLVIKPAGKPVKTRKVREGWEESAKAMAAAGDDKLLDDVVLTNLDDEVWEW